MSNLILVVAQAKDDGIHRMSLEAICAAQQLAQTNGAEIVVALPHGSTEAAEKLAGCAVAKVFHCQNDRLTGYTPGAYAGALAALVEQLDSQWVILPHTYQSVDFMARLAVRVGAGMIPEVTSVTSSGESLRWSRPVLGGKLVATVTASGDRTMVSVQSGSWSADDVQTGTAELAAWPSSLEGAVSDREIIGTEQAAEEEVDLSQSEVIVAVGRGIGDQDKMSVVEELASALGAEVAASRPVIDSGWLPRDRQIGSSGQTVTPKLYVALGISGAIQHVVGMKGSQVVVSINKDAGAPIFAVSDYGIVGDLHEIVPLLTEAIREARL